MAGTSWQRLAASVTAVLLGVGLVVAPPTTSAASTATVNGVQVHQPIDGFGFSEAFGRGAIMHGSEGLSAARQREVLDLLLSRTAGAGLSILRLHIGSTANSSSGSRPVAYSGGRYHVFVSTTNRSGSYSMAYLNFTDWSQAANAQHHYLDQTPIGNGYKAAPQVFYFAPQNLWYLVYQTGNNAAYSTTTDIANPQSRTAPRTFYAGGMPQIIRDNIGNGYWVDLWVICDSARCYLFSSDDNGHLYRSETTMAQFPNGFTNTVIAMQDPARYPLWKRPMCTRSLVATSIGW